MDAKIIAQIRDAFCKSFHSNPILVASPGRINIIGEHTDYNEGFVFPSAIDKGIVAAFSKGASSNCVAYAFDVDETFEFSLDNLHSISNGNWRNYIVGVVAEMKKAGYNLEAFNLVFGGDIPKGAGLSSSAALENAIVYGLNALFQLNISKSEMIHIAQRAEHNYVGVKCGIMDQYASMFGQQNHALLLDCRTLNATPYELDLNGYKIVLINTNISHSLVDAEYNDRRAVCESVAQQLKLTSLRDATEDDLMAIKDQLSEAHYQMALYILQENKRVLKAANCLKHNRIIAFGETLFEAHDGAKHQFKISCAELDFLVDQARGFSGVVGSRMMGGGFGGCTINIVKNEVVERFTEQVSKAYLKSFGIACSVYFINISNGTHIINSI